MQFSAFRTALKPWLLPIAMVTGMLCHEYITAVSWLSAYLIFAMLLITYCRVHLAELRPDRAMVWLLLVQVAGSLAVYAALRPLSEVVAQAAFICVICPTATAAPVVTGMLGGKVGRVATYSLLSHGALALLAPVLLPLVNHDGTASAATATLDIAKAVLPLILGPLVLAAVLGRVTPRVHSALARNQGLSFYIWAVALIIVVGRSVSFVMQAPASEIPAELAIAGTSLGLCVAQFAIGRAIGRRYGDPISAAQSLGQKNTVLAIWIAMHFLNPLASIGPAAYVAWHNSYNSYQIYRKNKKSQVAA